MLFDAEYKAMLQPILDDPADDTARLIFADWLEEKQSSPLANFIRHGIAGKEIAGDFYPCGFLNPWYPTNRTPVIFRRGFPCDVILPWEQWLAEHQHWREWYPIEKVKLTTRPKMNTFQSFKESENILLHLRAYIVGLEDYSALYSIGMLEGSIITKILKSVWPKIEFELPPNGQISWEDALQLESQFVQAAWPPVIRVRSQMQASPDLTISEASMTLEDQEALFAQMLHKEGDSERLQADTGDDNRST